MSTAKYFSIRKSFYFMFIGLLVFVLYLYFVVGFQNIVTVIKGVNPVQYVFFYSLAICSLVVANFFWVASWRTTLRHLSVNISLRNAFLYYWTGYFIDLVVPCETVCGEVTRLYLVRKETNSNFGAIASAGITNRIVAYIITVTGLYLSTVFLFLRASAPPPLVTNFLLLILLGATVYLAVLLYLAFSNKAASKIASLIVRVRRFFQPKKYKTNEIPPQTKESLASFYNGFQSFRRKPRSLAVPFVFMTLSFLLNLFAYVLVFFALGIFSEPFSFFIIVYFIAGSVTDVAAGFSVGTVDILLSTIFIFYGLSPGLSGVTAALVRSVTFWCPLILGYVMLQIVGAKTLLSSNPQNAPQQKQTTEPSTKAKTKSENN